KGGHRRRSGIYPHDNGAAGSDVAIESKQTIRIAIYVGIAMDWTSHGHRRHGGEFQNYIVENGVLKDRDAGQFDVLIYGADHAIERTIWPHIAENTQAIFESAQGAVLAGQGHKPAAWKVVHLEAIGVTGQVHESKFSPFRGFGGGRDHGDIIGNLLPHIADAV